MFLNFLFKKKTFSSQPIPKTDFKNKWQKIEKLLKIKRDSAMKQALIESDKLLDMALREKRIKGETIGQRLKASQGLFDKNLYNSIWQAHKLRNNLVHSHEEILSFQIEKAVSVFKNALKNLDLL